MTTDIGQQLASITRRLAAVERASRLSSASLDDTHLEVRDSFGSLRAMVGQQADGTTAVNVVNGGPPPAPSTPTVAPAIGGLAVTWDGAFAGGVVIPLDWSRVEVHASITNGFTPSPATLQATIETPQGSTVYLPTSVSLYVVLLARNTSGTASTGTTQVGPYAPRTVVSGDVADGSITTIKIADNSISTPKLQANSVDTAQLNALAITTAKLAAGSVDATALNATAITGKTITGGTVTGATVTGGIVQTAGSGRRVVLNPASDTPLGWGAATIPAVELHSGSVSQLTPGVLVSDVDTSSYPFSGLFSPSLKRDGFYNFPITASLQLVAPKLGTNGARIFLQANNALSGNDYNMGDVGLYGYTATARTDPSHLHIYAQGGDQATGGDGAGSGPRASVQLDSAQVQLRVQSTAGDKSLYMKTSGVEFDGTLTQNGVDRGRGLMNYTAIVANTGTVTTTETVAITTPSTAFLAGRAYKVIIKGLAQSSVAADRVQMHVRKTNVSGAVYLDTMSTIVIPANTTNVLFDTHNIIKNATGSTITAALVLTYVRQAGTGNARIAADATNPAYVTIEDIGLAADYTNAVAMA